MRKKISLLVITVAAALNLFAGWKSNITMLVVPREAAPVRIAQDIARHDPVLLVTYRTTKDAVEIHAWNGTGWVAVSPEDYASGAFFSNPPEHVVLIEPACKTAPALLIPDGTWCASGNRLASTDPRVMIHLLGRYFDFSSRTWNEFAKRYRYSIEQINPGLINIPWWYYRGDELLAKRAQRNLNADLDLWSDLGITPPVTEPVEVKEEPADVPAIETPATESAEPESVAEPAPEAEPPAIESTDESAVLTTNDLHMTAAPEETPVVEENPFTTNDVPAADVVEQPAKKKSWWKLF